MKFFLRLLSIITFITNIFTIKDQTLESISFSINSLREQIEILNSKIHSLNISDSNYLKQFKNLNETNKKFSENYVRIR